MLKNSIPSSRWRTSSSTSLLNRQIPPLLPQGGEISIHLRRPQTGQQHLFFLRPAAEYAYELLFDGQIAYFNIGYDIHTLFEDIIKEYLYVSTNHARGFDEQLELLIDEITTTREIDSDIRREYQLAQQNAGFRIGMLAEAKTDFCFLDKTMISELRFRLMGLRSDIKNILRSTIPYVRDCWHIEHKLDRSFTCWTVIE